MLHRDEIVGLAARLSPRVVGARVQGVREPDGATLVLSLRRPGETVRLVLSAAPGLCRIAEMCERAPTRQRPGAVNTWARATLMGRPVTGLEVLAGDRVVVLSFAEGRIIAELTGRHANLFAVDPEGRIQAMAHADKGRRGLRPGGSWAVPPPPPPTATGPARFTDPVQVEVAAGERAARMGAARAEVERARLLKAARTRLRRLRQKVEADLSRCEQAGPLQRRGELLKGQLGCLVRGAAVARVRDWYAEGAPWVEIPVRPDLDGPANLRWLFKRCRRARDGQGRALERLAEVEAAEARLEAIAAEPLAPELLVEALVGAGLTRRRTQSDPRGRGAPAPRLPYRRFQSRAGEPILVGRGGADNHQLSFRVARGNDTWLHVRDAPGAHVIVPRAGRDTQPHPETLHDAVALAVHFSDLRGEPGAEVTLTLRKHLRPVPGGAPGRVTIAGGRAVRPLDLVQRLARLLATPPSG